MTERDAADGFSKAGALKLKQAIESYWRERGFDVVVYLREAPFSTVLRCARFEVCSDMVNGMPRKRPEDQGQLTANSPSPPGKLDQQAHGRIRWNEAGGVFACPSGLAYPNARAARMRGEGAYS